MIKLREHNKRPYEELKKALKEYRQAVYVSGVGTGKSFVFMKLLADSEMFKDKKCLYIVPQESISINIMTYKEFDLIKDRVTFINMQQFTSTEKAKKLMEGYDLIVDDEVHHAASEIYGKSITEAVAELNIPFLGLTATPVRMDNIDIRDEFAAVVDGISNFDAIRLGLMPQFTYRIGAPDKDLASLRERISKEERNTQEDNSERIIMCRDAIKDIAETYPRKKYIAFSGNIGQLRRDKKVVEYAFPDKKIYELHYASANAKDVLTAFDSADSGILMTVDMALEGIHLDNVDGIILFRNVQSIPVFEQMLGRVCSIGKKVSPVVIDCSARGVDLLQKLIKNNDERWKNITSKKRVELETLYQKLQEIESEEGNAEEEDMDMDVTEMDSCNTHKSVKVESSSTASGNTTGSEAAAPAEGTDSAEVSSAATENSSDNGNESTPFTPRDILHIALGSHEEWEDVAEFEKAWAESNPAKHREVRESRVRQAVDVWNRCKGAYASLSAEVTEKCMGVIASKCGITITEMKKAIAEGW